VLCTNLITYMEQNCLHLVTCFWYNVDVKNEGEFMKTSVNLIVIFFLVSSATQAMDATFTSSGTISGTDNYSSVTVQNNGTTVNMLDGQVGYLSMNDASIFNMSGGRIEGSIFTSNLSTFNLLSGTIDATAFEFDGNVNISGGNITGWGKFATWDGDIVNITGGNLHFSMLMPYGELNIYGGLLTVDNFESYMGTTNIFGYGFNYDSVGQTLTGYLSDHNQFAINQVSGSEYQHINLVPEPTSILLLSIGALYVRRKSKRIHR
jgi:hypothetical protein